MAATPLAVTGDDAADRLLRDNPLALLLAMLLDQQVPMEWAFGSPARLAERLGDPGALDARTVVAAGPEALDEAFRAKPALHRYPGSMAARAYALCEHLVEHYDGDAGAVWRGVTDADELSRRLRALPGYGKEKAQIFLALLAKRFDIRPSGWESAAGPFADGTPRSVADIDGPEARERVREWKKQQKARGRTKSE